MAGQSVDTVDKGRAVSAGEELRHKPSKTYHDLFNPSGKILRIRLSENEVALDGACPLGDTNFSSVVSVDAQVQSDEADGDMERALKSSEFFEYGDSIRAQMGPLAGGLSALHNAGIAHCDLKQKNILVFKSSQHDLSLKIADFGHALRISPETHPANDHFCKGTFSAPETWRKEAPRNLEPVDIWMLGCMLMEMVAFIRSGSAGFTQLREIRASYVTPMTDYNTFHDTQSLSLHCKHGLET